MACAKALDRDEQDMLGGLKAGLGDVARRARSRAVHTEPSQLQTEFWENLRF